jgi:hypothetical protein
MAKSDPFHTLPANLPAPSDNGACAHLVGLAVPSLTLFATDGRTIDLAATFAPAAHPDGLLV